MGGRALCLPLQHFVKSDDAGAALSALDDSEFMGSHIQVQVREAPAVLGPVFDSTAIFVCVTIVYFFLRIVLAPCVTCFESLTILSSCMPSLPTTRWLVRRATGTDEAVDRPDHEEEEG